MVGCQVGTGSLVNLCLELTGCAVHVAVFLMACKSSTWLLVCSSSPMSPAYSPVPEDLFSWVGIIMYLPSEDAAVREAISKR